MIIIMMMTIPLCIAVIRLHVAAWRMDASCEGWPKPLEFIGADPLRLDGCIPDAGRVSCSWFWAVVSSVNALPAASAVIYWPFLSHPQCRQRHATFDRRLSVCPPPQCLYARPAPFSNCQIRQEGRGHAHTSFRRNRLLGRGWRSAITRGHHS